MKAEEAQRGRVNRQVGLTWTLQEGSDRGGYSPSAQGLPSLQSPIGQATIFRRNWMQAKVVKLWSNFYIYVLYFLQLTFTGAVTKGPHYGSHLWYIFFRLSSGFGSFVISGKTNTDLSNVDSFIVLMVEHLKSLNNLPLHLRGQHLNISTISKETAFIKCTKLPLACTYRKVCGRRHSKMVPACWVRLSSFSLSNDSMESTEPAASTTCWVDVQPKKSEYRRWPFLF